MNLQAGELKIAHDFYHMRYGSICAATGSEGDKAREASAIKEAPKVVDLFDFCMKQSISMPPFVWYPGDLIFDVMAGRIKIFVQFDYEKFFELARSQANLQLKFVVGKQARRIVAAKVSGPLIEFREARFVAAENASLQMFFGARFFARVYLLLMRPRDLLNSLLALIEEATNDRSFSPSDFSEKR